MILFELSDDLLVEILKTDVLTVLDIVSFSGVSRRARAVARNPILWRDVAVPSLDDQSAPRPRKTKRARKPKMSRAALAIDSISKIAGEKLQSLDLAMLIPDTRYPSHLSRLDILASRCSLLRALSLPPSDALEEAPFCSFVGSCPFLRRLYLRNVSTLTIPFLARLLQGRPEISHLSVAGCRNMRGSRIWDALQIVASELVHLDVSMTNLTSLPLVEMGRLCPKLEVLLVDGCRHLQFPRLYHDAAFPSLQTFRADFVGGDYLNEFLRLLFRTAKLKILSLNRTWSALDLSLFTLHQPGVSSIVHLELSGQNVTDFWFADVVLTLLSKNLRALDVSNCRLLTGALLRGSHRLRSLEQLNISGTRFCSLSVTTLVRYVAPNLRLLKTDGCRSIVDRNMRRDPLGFLRREGGS